MLLKNVLAVERFGQVLHRRSEHLRSVKRSSVGPRATMNDVLPPSMFIITPALPCRDLKTLLGVVPVGVRSTLLGGLALGEAARSGGCPDLACRQVLTILNINKYIQKLMIESRK